MSATASRRVPNLTLNLGGPRLKPARSALDPVARALAGRQIKLDTAAREADEDVRRFEEEQRAVLAAASAGVSRLRRAAERRVLAQRAGSSANRARITLGRLRDALRPDSRARATELRSQDASLDHHRAKTAEETAAIIAAMDRSFEAGKDSASSFLVAVATSTDALSKHAKLLSGRK